METLNRRVHIPQKTYRYTLVDKVFSTEPPQICAKTGLRRPI